MGSTAELNCCGRNTANFDSRLIDKKGCNLCSLSEFVERDVITRGLPHDRDLYPYGMGRRIAHTGSGARDFFRRNADQADCGGRSTRHAHAVWPAFGHCQCRRFDNGGHGCVGPKQQHGRKDARAHHAKDTPGEEHRTGSIRICAWSP